MTIKIIGIDLAKDVFELCGLDVNAEILLQAVREIPACVIRTKACTGAFFWQRQFEALGHEVRIIAPQHVRSFGRRQKNDRNDAEVIAIAVTQARMRFVPKKRIAQQDIQTRHRARRRRVNHQTALVSQMRGILLDHGIAFGQSITRARRMIPEVIEDLENELIALCREIPSSLLELMTAIDKPVQAFDRRIDQLFRANAACQRAGRTRGVGAKTETAVIAAVGMGTTSTTCATWPTGWVWSRISISAGIERYSWGSVSEATSTCEPFCSTLRELS